MRDLFVDGTHEIWVNVYGNAPQDIPVNHPVPWISDPLDFTFYDAHHYWDYAASAGGNYISTFATELAFENAQGY